MTRPVYFFLYHVEFPYFANPPETKGRFEADLKAFVKARRLRSSPGLHGGMINTYGVIYRKRWGVKEADRIAVADWIKAQRICATAPSSWRRSGGRGAKTPIALNMIVRRQSVLRSDDG